MKVKDFFFRQEARVIILLLSSPMFTGSVFAEVKNITKLAQVVVTATKTERSIDKVTASVRVITEEDIQSMGAVTLKDVLQKTPGLGLQYGTFPAASSVSKSSVSIRGIGAAGTLWLLDGRRLAGEVKNPYDMNRIPASMIERIEVVKGPMSALYGADAVGGIINIITRQPEEGLRADVSVSGGANSEGDGANKQLSANVRGGVGNFRGSFYVSIADADPYTETEKTNTRVTGNKVKPSSLPANDPLRSIKDNYDVDVSYRENASVTTVGGRIEYDVTVKLTVGADFNWFEEERDGVYRGNFHPTAFMMAGNRIPAFDVPVNSKDENQRLDIAADIQFDVTDNFDVNFRVYNSYYEKRNTTTMQEFADFGFPSESKSASSAMNGNAHVSSYELRSNWQVTDQQLLTGGMEYRNEKREATIFSQSSDMDTREVSYRALYLQNDFSVSDNLALTIGGRYDQYDREAYTDEFGTRHDKKSDSEATFRAGAIKNFSELYNLRINVAQGYRVPNVRELFIQKQTPAGMQLGAQTIDPRFGKLAYGLKAERTLSYEVSLSGSRNAFSYTAVVFYNDIKDKIEQVEVQGIASRYFTLKNVNDVVTKGAELTLDYEVTDKLQSRLFWTELRTENKDTGKELEFNPDRVVSLAFDRDVTQRSRVGIDVTYTGEQYYVHKNQEMKTNAYTLANLTLGYRFGVKQQFDLYGGVNNIFDEKVAKRLGSNVGTFYFAGLRVSF